MKLLTSLLFVSPFFAFATEYASWRSYSSAKLFADEDSVAPGQKTTLGFDVQLAKGWHTYWINPGDSGTVVRLELKAEADGRNFDLLTGPLLFPIPERLTSGPITSFVYHNEVMFLADLVMPDSLPIGSKLKIHIEAEWLVCEAVCIPAFDSFDLVLPVKNKNDVKPSPQSEKFELWRSRLPEMKVTGLEEHRNETHAELALGKPDGNIYVDFFPLRGSQLANERPKVLSESPTQVKLALELRKTGVRRQDLFGLMLTKNGSQIKALQWGEPSYGFIVAAAKPSVVESGATLATIIGILISAFLGGLILNLMPCVFPILSMKLLSIVKQAGQHSRDVRAQNFAYVAGVVLSFLFIGVLLAFLRGAGQAIGWGFQLQSPFFVLGLIWLFFLLAVQMFGYFELTWINPNWGGQAARQKGMLGSFFTGVLAVVVASPCTAPFMGAALGFALSQNVIVLLSVFIVMGLGLAFPYLVFALFPAWVRILPRPGSWMNTLKELMAFPLLLTCVWLTWLLAQVKGNLSVGLALTGIVGLFFALWLGHKHRWLTRALIAFIFICGFSTLAYFPESVGTTASMSELEWKPFSKAEIERVDDQTVFLDFTADWCLSCKLNEHLVFDNLEVINLIKQNHVKLLKGDWTRQDPNITQFLNNYRRVGVPFYIAFGPGAPEGKIFPEILTPDEFKKDLESVLHKGVSR
jgi:thiol:disulfide interchange protein DsbD